MDSKKGLYWAIVFIVTGSFMLSVGIVMNQIVLDIVAIGTLVLGFTNFIAFKTGYEY